MRTRFRPNRWESSLAAGGWRPVCALAAVSLDACVDVNPRRDARLSSDSGSARAEYAALR